MQGKPIVVLSNNDGCVIARNREAKLAGVKMGEPYFQLRKLIQRYGVFTFSSNYELYTDMSNRVMTVLEAMSPVTEIYSIDEAFLKVSGVQNCMSLEQFGRDIRQRVLQCTGLTVGVGIAQTKTLAKLANHAAKQWSKTGGVLDLSDPLRQRKLLAITPVQDIWGIGHRIGKKLNSLGINTALQLADMNSQFVRKNFNVVLERTVRELNGVQCLELEEFIPTKQQIICSRSFGEKITDYQAMREAICEYAVRAAEKLRGEHQYCRQIAAFIKTSPFASDGTYYGNVVSTKLHIPTQDSRDIIAAALRCLDAIWKNGHRYQKGGVMLGDFYSQGTVQLGLFDDNQPKANSAALMEVLDGINKSGKGKVWFAGQGIQKAWQMKRKMLSPAYTTRWSELPIVS